MKPEDVAAALSSQECWYVSMGGSSVPSFMLALGKKIPLDKPLRNPRHPPDFRMHRGSLELLVWCTWRLQCDGRVVASSDQEAADATALRQLQGAMITQAVCTPPAWDLTLRFSNDLEVVIFCDHVDPGASISTNWELWTPDGYISVGPGEAWHEDSEATS